MALFNRNKTNQAGMAPEVSDYYKAEGRERAWVAWVLAITTLLVTIFVVLGIFYGGRWAFRKVKDNDKPAPVAVQTDETKSDEQTSTDTTPSANEPSSTSSTSSSTSSTPVATSTTTTPTNSTTKSDLPSTGPGDTLAVFASVSVLGYFVHRRFLAKV